MKSLKAYIVVSICLAGLLQANQIFAQLPTVAFNIVYNVSVDKNDVSITTVVSGTNFKFIGDKVSSGDFVADGNAILGRFIYVNSQGNNTIIKGKITQRNTDGSLVNGILFEGVYRPLNSWTKRG